MRILHINNYYAERFFYENLYKRQIRDDDIAVAVLVHNRFETNHKYDSYVSVIRCFTFIDRILFFPRLIKSKKALEKEIDVSRYDIIHAYSLFTNGSIARMISKKTGAPFIVTVRNVDVNRIFKSIFFLRGYGKRLLLSADQVVFLSKEVKRTVKEKYCNELSEDKCVVIPNGVDDFWIRNMAKAPKRNENNDLRVMYAGDINSNKNLIFVAKTLNMLRIEGIHKNITYEVIGTVQDERVLNELKRYSFVSVMERMPKEELIEHYQKADIYIMVSKNESFGLTYVEAMSQGTPVIYTKGQGFDGQFDEGIVGYHVGADSMSDLISKISRVLSNYERLSDNCIKNTHVFSWDSQSERIYGMYTRVLSEKDKVRV